MKISEELVDHLSHLARLQFEGPKKKAIMRDLENIISFMAKLNEVPTDNIDPLIFMNDEINNLREDLPVRSISHEDALKNAPKKDSDYFRIPKVLDK